MPDAGRIRGGGIAVGGGGSLVAPGGDTGAPVIKENKANDSSGGGGISVYGGGIVDLTGVMIHGNEATAGCGGGLDVSPKNNNPIVKLQEVEIVDNTSEDCGGGLAIFAGEIELDNVEVVNNSAATDGGGLYLTGSANDVSVLSSTIRLNVAEERGGGIAQLGGATLRLTDTSIVENGALDGGGIYVLGPDSEIDVFGIGGDDYVERNSASRGGGLFVDGGTASLFNQTFHSNSAETDGGALFQTGEEASVTLDRSNAELNTANATGGAFAVDGGELSILGADLLDNSAGTDGGALAITRNAVVTAEGVWFHHNSAEERGGAVAMLHESDSNPQLLVTGALMVEVCEGGRSFPDPQEYCSEFRGNESTAQGGQGGAIFMEEGTAKIRSTAFLSNKSDQYGAAILLDGYDNGIA